MKLTILAFGAVGVISLASAGTALAGSAVGQGEVIVSLTVSQSSSNPGVGGTIPSSPYGVQDTQGGGGQALGEFTYSRIDSDDYSRNDTWSYDFNASATSTDGTAFGRSHLDGAEITTLNWDGLTDFGLTLNATFNWGPNSASPDTATELSNARAIGQVGICLNDQAPQSQEGYATGPCGYVADGTVRPGVFVGLGGLGGFNGLIKDLSDPDLLDPDSTPLGSYSVNVDLTPYLRTFPKMVVYSSVTGVFAEASVLAVPEPSTWATMVFGFMTVGALIRRARRQSLVRGSWVRART